jgi:hypothetical protein
MLAMARRPDFLSWPVCSEIPERCRNYREQFVLGAETIKGTNQMAKLIFQIVLIEPSGLDHFRLPLMA